MDFDTFISVPRTALEYAQLEVPGYPVSKFRMREQLHKERVPRYQNQRRGGGYVYCFHELPKKWQEDIINHFQTLNQNEIEIHQKTSSKELTLSYTPPRRNITNAKQTSILRCTTIMHT